MKSYLNLVPISAKVHKRQNRMTILCIIISVLLVTTIFSGADMMIRTESIFLQKKHGSWHIQLENPPKEAADKIIRRPDVTAVGWSEKFNDDAELPYYIGEKKAVLCGTDETYMTRLTDGLEEGSFPQKDNEILLSSNAKIALHAQIGESITLRTPAGDTDFIVYGFGSDEKEYYQGQTYLVAVYMTRNAFTGIMEQNGIKNNPFCYIQYQDAGKAEKSMSDLQEQYQLPKESISENTAVMGIAGKSKNTSIMSFYGIAAVLFVLVLSAGVLMISSSMNSNVAQRTKFFGMMRCIGASRSQIIRFVRLEALSWCKTAVPVGMVLGTAVSWVLCAILHYGIGGEFSVMPVFALSPVGLISGAVVGVVTVLLAARSPAKRAAKVSPMAAVSGNGETKPSVKHAVKSGFGKIEWTLGVHHAIASKRNWLMMTASFSLSIILFLCFFVGIDFAGQLLPSFRSWQPDISLNGYANSLVLDRQLSDEISQIPGVSHVFGSSYINKVPVTSSREGIENINLVSYTDYLLDGSKDRVVQGDISTIYGDSNCVMIIRNKDNPMKVGDTIRIGENEMKITCAVSDGLYPSEMGVICSQETFDRLMGEQNYSLICIQLGKDATEKTVQKISDLTQDDVIFTDNRQSNQEIKATYLATRFIGYGFLAVVAIITLFNIINSISMSVTARIKQYGAMRAVGMDGNQLTGMIAAEAFTYAVSGLIVGCVIGLLLSGFLHVRLLTHFFGIPWEFPVVLLGVIIVFILVSAAAAVYAPVKRLRNMVVTETINEL